MRPDVIALWDIMPQNAHNVKSNRHNSEINPHKFVIFPPKLGVRPHFLEKSPPGVPAGAYPFPKDFAPAGATKGLSDRPLETFGAHLVGQSCWIPGRGVAFLCSFTQSHTRVRSEGVQGATAKPPGAPAGAYPFPRSFGLRPTKGLSDRPLETFGAHLVGQRFFVPGQESYFRLLLCPAPYKRHVERRGPGGDRKAQFAIVVIYDDSVAHWASGRLHPPLAAPASAPMVARRPKPFPERGFAAFGPRPTGFPIALWKPSGPTALSKGSKYRGRKVTFLSCLTDNKQEKGCEGVQGATAKPPGAPAGAYPLPKHFGLRPTKGLSDRPLETFGAHCVGQSL